MLRLLNLFLFSLYFATLGCAPNDEGSDSSDSDEAPASLVEVDALSDLALSEAMSISVPASVKATGDSVSDPSSIETELTAMASKSAEACWLRTQYNDMVNLMAEASMELCLLEAMKGTIKIGTPYEIVIPLDEEHEEEEHGEEEDDHGDGGHGLAEDEFEEYGEETIGVYITRGDSDELTVYICEEGSLTRKILVTGRNQVGVRGSLQIFEDHSETIAHDDGTEGTLSETGRIDAKFDNKFQDPERVRIVGQNTLEGTSEENVEFVSRRRIGLSFSETGISILKISERGEETFVDPDTNETIEASFVSAGAARIGVNLGSMLLREGGSIEDGVETSGGSYRAYFDSAGNRLGRNASELFHRNGNLRVRASDIPAPLSSDFSIEELEGWDCSGERVEFPIDDEGIETAINSCHEKLDNTISEEDCFESEFAHGDEEEIDDSQWDDELHDNEEFHHDHEH